MAPPAHVQLGPLARKIIDAAVWKEKDEFPASQIWADDFENILAFLKSQGEFDRFRKRLCARERDGALAEARAGYYFHRNGFRITQWEPEEVPGIPGDLEIAYSGAESIFLEVKCPTWEGELNKEEIRNNRTQQPKHIHGEARSFNSEERVIYVVGKALHKFSPTRVNLVVVVDNLFVSPLDCPVNIVRAQIMRELADTRYENVSGVFLINPQHLLCDADIKYRALFIPGSGRPLPDPVQRVFHDEKLLKGESREGD